MTARWGVGVALAALLVLPGLLAGERKHTVRPGESASAIALGEYGNSGLGSLLLAYNGRRGTTIRPGEELRVPFCEVHRVRSGDSWSALAQRYLGSAAAWSSVAELNGLAPEQALRVGQEIVFPVVIEHRLERGETLARLAERFYDDAARSRLLAEFNRLEDPRRLSVGETVRIPLISLRSRAAKPPPVREARNKRAQPAAAELARTAPQPTPEPAAAVLTAPVPTAPVLSAPEPSVPVALFGDDLATAERAFRSSDFEQAATLLEELRQLVAEHGAETERRELWRQLSFVYVALDRPDEACSAYGALTRDGGSASFDPDLVSPKIRAVLSACVSQ